MAVTVPVRAQSAAPRTWRHTPSLWGRMPLKAKVGAVLLGLFVLAAIFGPYAAPYSPSYQSPLSSLSMHPPRWGALARYDPVWSGRFLSAFYGSSGNSVGSRVEL